MTLEPFARASPGLEKTTVKAVLRIPTENVPSGACRIGRVMGLWWFSHRIHGHSIISDSRSRTLDFLARQILVPREDLMEMERTLSK